MTQLLTIQELLAEKLRSLARNHPYDPSPLNLKVIKANPLELNDANDLVLKQEGEYQSKLRVLEPNEKVTVQNYEVQIKWEKNEIASVKIQIRELNYGGKKIGGLDLTFQIDNAHGRLVNQAGAGFINRLRKAETANKFSDIQFINLVSDQEHKDLVKQRKSKSLQYVQMQEQKEQIDLDDASLKHLRKLRKVINRSDLFNLLVKKGVRDGDSKRTVRHLIFPDAEIKGSKDPLAFQKKTFSRTLVHQLLEEYKN